MPASRKINKDDIIRVCLDIVRKDGINGINARRVAKELNCSVQPIFFNFSPNITLVAISITGKFVTLLIYGTVLLERGFTSIT